MPLPIDKYLTGSGTWYYATPHEPVPAIPPPPPPAPAELISRVDENLRSTCSEWSGCTASPRNEGNQWDGARVDRVDRWVGRMDDGGTEYTWDEGGHVKEMEDCLARAKTRMADWEERLHDGLRMSRQISREEFNIMMSGWDRYVRDLLREGRAVDMDEFRALVESNGLDTSRASLEEAIERHIAGVGEWAEEPELSPDTSDRNWVNNYLTPPRFISNLQAIDFRDPMALQLLSGVLLDEHWTMDMLLFEYSTGEDTVQAFIKLGSRMSKPYVRGRDRNDTRAEKEDDTAVVRCVASLGNGDTHPLGIPEYMVCLGEAFIFTKSRTDPCKPERFVSTNYFVTMDMISPKNSIWLVYNAERADDKGRVSQVTFTNPFGTGRMFLVCLLDSVDKWEVSPDKPMIPGDPREQIKQRMKTFRLMFMKADMEDVVKEVDAGWEAADEVMDET
ncbi:hypothetical protein QBC33DRAFT_560539 [Phialemonium atrogriseum]|uniref:Uncharacterized protein n=1 Tax=Phialemonium atrogriseum TaxID=1093897 RepID=A0AAJ0BYT9_9PEZI|nr:uncharacterized protein QBC33DRAFT_560539 [Phialemonium atrogriseum]KAK1765619.1 hypothetical protein QBC33DRAFT_560539 [Phialemonium atrogriseum]